MPSQTILPSVRQIASAVAIGLLSQFSFMNCLAGPADPAGKRVMLADGTETMVYILGDENSHAIVDNDGYIMQLDKDKGTFIQTADKFATYSDAVVAQQNCSSSKRRNSSSQRRILAYDYPTSGNPKALVVLMAFSDVAFESVDDPKTFYDALLNEQGFTYSNGATGSAYDYYNDASCGQFTPEFVVVGPVTLSKEQTYYGYDDASGNEIYVSEAIVEACELLDDDVDFSEYDLDGDGYVDNIFFWYAGGGQADDPYGTDYIWPHAATLEGTWDVELILDGVHISRYACTNEVRYSEDGDIVPSGFGNFIHEFSHVLGLQDHYDVYYGSNTFDPDSWDVMATGSYNNNMHTPPTFSAFERAELGWLEYNDLTLDADSITKISALTQSNTAFRIKVLGCESSQSADGDEFYVLENRQLESWDAYLPGHGMLVWHIDADSARWASNRINTLAHQYVDVVEADGIMTDETRDGDAFPGTSNITTYDLLSWDKDSMMTIDDVAETDGVIHLLIANTTFILPSPQGIEFTEIGDSSITFAATDLNEALETYPNITYAYAVYEGSSLITDGASSNASESIHVDGLSPATDYTVMLYAMLGSYVSEAVSTTITTEELIFEKRMPTGLEATDISSNSFTGTWDAVEDADNYAIVLYEHSYSDDAVEQGYDFTDKASGLPELWESSSTTFYSVSGYYGVASPSLRMSSDGDYLIIAYDDMVISAVSFWARSNKNGNTIVIEGYDDGEWTEIESISISTDGGSYNSQLPSLSSQLRLSFSRSSGYIVIDDVIVTCLDVVRTEMEGHTEYSSGATTAVFNDLTAGGTYGFRVTALQGDLNSYTSEECVVTLPETTGFRDIENETSPTIVGIYDLSGRKVKARNGSIRIIKYSDGTTTISK